MAEKDRNELKEERRTEDIVRGKRQKENNGQSYKPPSIVIYISRVINIRNLLVSTTPQL